MSMGSMEKGIKAIKQGNHAEGENLLRYALRSGELQGKMRALACNWLAFVIADQAEQIQLYRDALKAEPGNKHAGERLAEIYSLPDNSASQPPSPASPTPSTPSPDRFDLPPINSNDYLSDSSRHISQGYTPVEPGPAYTPNPPSNPNAGAHNPSSGQNPGAYPYSPNNDPGYVRDSNYPPNNDPGQFQPVNYNPNQPTGPEFGGGAFPVPDAGSAGNALYRTVTILGGHNGTGTGFFVTETGLVATTRFVVSAVEDVIIELDRGRQFQAQVARAFPELDLAFIETGLRVSQLLSRSSRPAIPDNMPLTALNHDGRVMSGLRRASQSNIKPDWFPTTIAQVLDAGGNPIFDNRNYLVGMLTCNANRTSAYLFGLSINAIYRCVERYLHEVRNGVRRAYCPTCGYLSQAGNIGGFYCEMCGGVLPAARQVQRYPLPQPQLEQLYGESHNQPCRFCGSRTGMYMSPDDHRSRCLRCGKDQHSPDGR